MHSGCEGVERHLFKAAVASSAARVCGLTRHGVTSNGKNVTTWWSQEVKNVVRAKKVAYLAWLQKSSRNFFTSAV